MMLIACPFVWHSTPVGCGAWAWKWYINLRIGKRGSAFCVVRPPYDRGYKTRGGAIISCERALRRLRPLIVDGRQYEKETDA